MDNVVTADFKVGGKRGSLDAVTGADAGDPALAPTPSQPIFTPVPVDDPDASETHGEYKVIEAFADEHPNRRVKGRLRMYSEHYPCRSCRDVMQQFLRAYPRMRLELGYTHSPGTPEEFPPDPVNPRIEISHIEAPGE